MLNNGTPSLWKWVAVVGIGLLSGCATAYHDYSDCCIPYLYCRPSPLPFVNYEGCHCPTPGASQYLGQQQAISSSSSPLADAPTPAPAPPSGDSPVAPMPQ